MTVWGVRELRRRQYKEWQWNGWNQVQIQWLKRSEREFT